MEHQINEEIRDKEVRLIGDDGEQLGILPIQQAQDIAVEKGMDLVKIAPQAKPPVCKIMDYGKFRFEQAKREKEARKNQRVVEIKEIRLTPNIDIGDPEHQGKERLPLPAGRQQGQGFGSLPWPRGHARVAWSGSAPSLRGAVLGVQHGRKAAQARRPPDADVSGARKGQVKPTRRYSANSERSKTLCLRSKRTAVQKRGFSVTKNGKFKRGHVGKRHLLNGHGKTTKLKRHLRKEGFADSTNVAQLKRLLPYK